MFELVSLWFEYEILVVVTVHESLTHMSACSYVPVMYSNTYRKAQEIKKPMCISYSIHSHLYYIALVEYASTIFPCKIVVHFD